MDTPHTTAALAHTVLLALGAVLLSLPDGTSHTKCDLLLM